MSNEEVAQAKALAISILQGIGPADETRLSFNELIGEEYAFQLAKMTEAEAANYLDSVDSLTLLKAYLFFSRRLAGPVLAPACQRLMCSPKLADRYVGVGGIGIWLEGTQDKSASRTLARMIRNRGEVDKLRLAAYASLKLINKMSKAKGFFWRVVRATHTVGDTLKDVDWDFVDLFL
jgi:hypothetical protein